MFEGNDSALVTRTGAGGAPCDDPSLRSEPNGRTVMPKEVESGSDGTAIRPLTVSFPETELTELRRRIKVTRWPERETVTDATQGVQLAMPHARRHPRQHHD